MENFTLLNCYSVSSALTNVFQHPELWNQHSLRTKHQGTVHSDVSDIWIRFNNIEGDISNILNDLECIWYTASQQLPYCLQLVHQLMFEEQGSRLGRVFLSKIPHGGKISRHCDEGDYPHYYERYHIVLQGSKGNYFFCGDECVEMLTGQVWWFQNLVEHEVFNDSGEDRIHLIVDIRA